MSTARRCFARLLLFLAIVLVARLAPAAEFMFQATVDGETFEGKPLAWTDYEMHLLGRDGRLHDFNPKDAKNAKKTSPHFVGYTIPEMKRELYREFGEGFDIDTTQHYIVIHPRTDHSDWANRCEQLYRSCLAYFRVRGFRIEEPKFPLVAVVFPNRDDYYRATAKDGLNLPQNFLGHYLNTTNRMQLFDITADNPRADWSDNASTIIHEATHQTAFNVGIHNRFADQPRWLVEGLAMMFEARGVWNAASYPAFKDRVNAVRLANFRSGLKKRQSGTLGNLVASDRMFETDGIAAYAEAWALFFYLCETRPRELAEYLEQTAARPDFTSYFATQRVADFAKFFGSDFKKLEANFLAWMADIR